MKKEKVFTLGLFMWHVIIILLIIPCIIVDIIGLIPMIILRSMDKDNSPYPYIQYLIEMW